MNLQTEIMWFRRNWILLLFWLFFIIAYFTIQDTISFHGKTCLPSHNGFDLHPDFLREQANQGSIHPLTSEFHTLSGIL